MDFLDLFLTLRGLAALIIGFGFIVFVHELGHFMVAKWVGIRATQFAIGFGHSMLTWRKGIGFRVGTTEPEYERLARKQLEDEGVDVESLPERTRIAKLYATADALGLGETEYRLNYIPLGGYVKMLGQEDIDPAAHSEDPRSYTSKPVWARMCVISAGVIMNLIFAMIFFIIAFMAGVAFPPAEIGEVIETQPAATTYALGHEGDENYRGLRYGDRVLAVNGREPMDFTDIVLASALSGADAFVHLTIERDGEEQPLEFSIKPERGPDGLFAIGAAPPNSLVLRKYFHKEDGWESLVRAGVQPLMRVTAVNGEAVNEYHEFMAAVASQRSQPIELTFTDMESGQSATWTTSAMPLLHMRDVEDMLGLSPAVRIARIRVGSPADQAGIEPGDVVARIGQVHWPRHQDFVSMVRSAPAEGLDIDLLRDDAIVRIGLVRPAKGLLGVQYDPSLHISEVRSDSPAATLNLVPGSRLTTVNDEALDDFTHFVSVLSALPSGETARITYELYLAGNPQETGELVMDETSLSTLAQLDWHVFLPLRRKEILLQTDSPIVAAQYGLRKTNQTMISVYLTIARLVQGRVPPSEMRGPIGIADAGTQIARHRGFTYLIFFLGLISVNLAVINFLPIPVVDGGHMVFLIAEKLKGSPVSPRVQIAATYVGLLLILGVFVMTFYYDISRFFPGAS